MSLPGPSLDVESILLKTIESSEIADTFPWSALIGADHSLVVGTMKSLEAEGYLLAKSISMESYALTEEADRDVKFGSPEAQLFKVVADAGPVGSDESGLKVLVGEEAVKIGLGKCLKNKWVTRDKATGRYSATVAVIDSDELVDQLQSVERSGWWLTGSTSPIDEKLAKALKQRQLITLLKRVSFAVSRGPNWASQRRLLSADITKEMIESGTWASSTFKDYNFESAGKEVGGGHIHALMRVLKVEFIGAPYEADAQIAYLSREGLVDAVISEDSDMLPFSCQRVLFKMDSEGAGKEIQLNQRLSQCEELPFRAFSPDMFLNFCILSGCDYLPILKLFKVV